MFALLARLFGFPQTPAQDTEDGVAQSLMEKAEFHTGSDARQLRRAAVAYLSVVR
ncbi:hypothetical protein [Caenimonas koreensis]|uniref:Uncharacterized protein n=1 Tax=Caenimonas koreensis DSM 17982 TaxID=1121255 RepID=A0A844AR30_9BURK|nr:hypothetical protein [Caenimonas koreensis]MRD46780.1 hypothetical protein [Caenimonas koreensis DSM 17982]